MKHLFFTIFCLAILSLGSVQAQRFAYVDSEYILSKIPKYADAQKQIDALSEQWRKEADAMRQNIEKKYQEYQAQEVLLTETMRKQRQEEILKLEQQMQKFQQDKFGYDGELVQKRQSIVKPIQDEVFEAVEKVATRSGLNFIFDKATVTMLYADDKFDKSDDVLRLLGY